MREAVVRGTSLGQGAPKTIVSLMGKDANEVVAEARQAVVAGAELLEWRVDYLRDLALATSVAQDLREEQLGIPLVATVRTKGQGGLADVDGRAYAELCRTLARSEAVDIVDVELDKGDDLVRDLVGEVHDRDRLAIVSHHDFAVTPPTERMVELLEHMVELGADLPKLAVMARDRTDCLRLMEASACVNKRLDVPTVAISMGMHGMLSRLAGETCGSALTFCAVGRASAPGQVELRQARQAIASLHAALAGQGGAS